MTDNPTGINAEPPKGKQISQYDLEILNGPKTPREPSYFPATLKEGIEQQIDLEELYTRRDRETLERYHGLRHFLFARHKKTILDKTGGKLDETTADDLASTIAIDEAKRTIYSQILNQQIYEKYIAEHEKGRTDPLTGLPLRVPFFERLREQIDSRVPYGILFVDIDRFKKVNDDYEHDAGDLVLVQAAERVRASIRQGQILTPGKSIDEQEIRNTDFAARFGGEEIVVLISGVTQPDELAIVGNRIVESFNSSEFYISDNRTIRVTTSVGGALPNFTDPNETPIDVIRRADKNLYDAKELGRNRYIGEGSIIDVEPSAVI